MVVISEPEYVVGTAITGNEEVSAIALPKPMVEPPPIVTQQSALTDFAISRAASTAFTGVCITAWSNVPATSSPFATARTIAARSEALYGAWLAGLSISTTGNAIHHKLCHVLGGFGLPHAETHSIVLPHALRYNADAAPQAMRRIARALGAESAPTGMWQLENKLGIPMKLADIGMKRDDLERAAKIAVQTPYPNPRKVEYQPVLELLHNAYEGRKPQ